MINPFRDPCKTCIVDAICTQSCEAKFIHNNRIPYYVVAVFVAQLVFAIAAIFTTSMAITAIFPLLDCKFYLYIHWVLGTSIGVYAILKSARDEYLEDRKRLGFD